MRSGIKDRTDGRAKVHCRDIIAVFSYNVFIGIAVATIFGSGFFFDLFWPERKESKAVKVAWKISSVVVSFMALADAIAVTVCKNLYCLLCSQILTSILQIIIATRRVVITNVLYEEGQALLRGNGPPNPIYRHNPYNVASTVILWPGVVASFARWAKHYILQCRELTFGQHAYNVEVAGAQ